MWERGDFVCTKPVWPGGPPAFRGRVEEDEGLTVAVRLHRPYQGFEVLHLSPRDLMTDTEPYGVCGVCGEPLAEEGWCARERAAR